MRFNTILRRDLLKLILNTGIRTMRFNSFGLNFAVFMRFYPIFKVRLRGLSRASQGGPLLELFSNFIQNQSEIIRFGRNRNRLNAEIGQSFGTGRMRRHSGILLLMLQLLSAGVDLVFNHDGTLVVGQ